MLDHAFFARGVTIPAHPLALDDARNVDWRAQRALSRYYVAAGVDALAVGVHTTQFELHDDPALLKDVWALAAGVAAEADRDVGLIAGICGDIDQALAEAEVARDLGYGAALLCGRGMTDTSEQASLERAARVGEVLPTIGFYLQDSVGGRYLSRDYWARLIDQPNLVAIKIAPFDAYRTVDVLESLVVSDRWNDVAILTGNDNTIVHDLVTPFTRTIDGQVRTIHTRGGLLGQWAVGTRAAAQLMGQVRETQASGQVDASLLALAPAVVEVNAAVFDVINNFAGCVPGVNEVLRQQGLVSTANVLNPLETLSAGQAELIASVRERFPDLLDETFVAENRDAWLS